MKKRNKTRESSVRDGEFTLPVKILLTLMAGIDMLPRPFESKTGYLKRMFSGRMNYRAYYQIITRLEEKGYVTIYKKNKILVPELTREGLLKGLFEKAVLPSRDPWDGKWRMIVFDIPEDAKTFRHELRFLLRKNGFRLIQKSVYINPFPLNTEAIRYLKENNLDRYIRVFRIDKVDQEQELKKIFGL